MAAREIELLPVSYFHVVFTLPSAIGDIAYHNKAVIYGLLFSASAETMLTIAADARHLGARIGITSVLHTWGSAMTHNPHVHMIVPGGGLAKDGSRWVSCKPNFCLPVRVLSKLFRRLMLTKLAAAHAAGKLQFFGAHAHLTGTTGPKTVLAYLSRYTHRVAISNRRLIALNEQSVTFKVKDYRIEGPGRYTTMTLDVGEFIRRFLGHVLPKGFHRIRHTTRFSAIFIGSKSRSPRISPSGDTGSIRQNYPPCPWQFPRDRAYAGECAPLPLSYLPPILRAANTNSTIRSSRPPSMPANFARAGDENLRCCVSCKPAGSVPTSWKPGWPSGHGAKRSDTYIPGNLSPASTRRRSPPRAANAS
jgi:hypothetical protein